MAVSLTGIQVSAQIKATLNQAIDASGGARTAACVQGDLFSLTLTSGTAADKADGIWEDQARSLSSSATEDIDVYDMGSINIGAGAGLGALGQAIANVEIAGILVRNRSTSDGTLNVGGKGTTAAWNSLFGGSDDDAILALPPGAIMFFACPDDPAWAVADTSNHLLQFEASGGDCDYDVILLTRSA